GSESRSKRPKGLPCGARAEIFAAVQAPPQGGRTDLDVAIVNASTGERVSLPASVNTAADELRLHLRCRLESAPTAVPELLERRMEHPRVGARSEEHTSELQSPC